MLGAGASTAFRYNMDNVAARTFTASASAVKQASLIALERMGIGISSADPYESGETIYARTANRDIEIDLERLTPTATRVRIKARDGTLFYDNATALEIVAQTEKILEGGVAAKYAPPAINDQRLTSN